MNNFNSGLQDFSFSQPRASVDIQGILRLVYLWMTFGLLTTAVVSWWVASDITIFAQIVPWRFPIFIFSLVVAFGLQASMSRISPTLVGILFFFYSAIVGLMVGVWVAYFVYVLGDSVSIGLAFAITSGIFGTMSIIGYTTKVDLSKYSTYFGIAIIGLLIAVLASWIFRSSAFTYVISIVGVILFTALTAYDTQRIKEMAQQMQYNPDKSTTTKMAIYGALMLYVDFLNIFLFLLRLFAGGRR